LSLPDDKTVEATGPDGATVEYNASANDAVDGSVPVDCQPASGSTFPIGETTVNCSATDNAGNTSNGSFKVTVNAQADTTAPETTIDSGPSGTVSETQAKFTFSSSEANSTFQCKLDNQTSWVACTSPKSYSNLAAKAHTFQVRATDQAGNTDLSPASRTWTVNIIACTITGTSANDTLTGTSGDDVICGRDGNDTIKGLGGNDILKGEGGGADKLFGGEGNDQLDGGIGSNDLANYADSTVAIIASLVDGTATGEGSDTLIGVESVTGSSKNDSLTGSVVVNTLSGGSGNDTLSGLDGADKLNGGGNADTIQGGSGNDSVVGNGGADNLLGDEGDDALNSKDNVNGNDSLDGGDGTDTKVTDATEKSIVNIP
jgi:Ca2+-binding RTX toxin-like protein